MADFTQPFFALPVVAVNGNGPHMKITLAASLVGATTVNVSLASGDYWNDRDFGDVANLANALCIAANAAEVSAGTNGVWAASEVTGDFLGRIKLSRTQGDSGDDVTNVLFTSSDFGGTMLGFTSNTKTPVSSTADPAVFNGTYQAGNQWIPQPASIVLMGINEKTPKDNLVVTSSADGTSTYSRYGSVDRREIVIMSVPGGGIWQHYADDSDYAGKVGATAGDVNCAFDKFRQQWRSIATGDYCRFYPDVDDTSTYVQLEPGEPDPWLGDTKQAVQVETEAPLRYILTLTAYDRGT